MKISEIKPNQSGIDVECKVVLKGTKKEIKLRAGGVAFICDLTIEDDSGRMILTLYNAEIARFIVGDKIIIKNGYTKLVGNNYYLNIGRYGTISKK